MKVSWLFVGLAAVAAGTGWIGCGDSTVAGWDARSGEASPHVDGGAGEAGTADASISRDGSEDIGPGDAGRDGGPALGPCDGEIYYHAHGWDDGIDETLWNFSTSGNPVLPEVVDLAGGKVAYFEATSPRYRCELRRRGAMENGVPYVVAFDAWVSDPHEWTSWATVNIWQVHTPVESAYASPCVGFRITLDRSTGEAGATVVRRNLENMPGEYWVAGESDGFDPTEPHRYVLAFVLGAGGWVRAWVDGAQVLDLQDVTLCDPSGGNYAKLGLYAAWMQRDNVPPGLTVRVWHDNDLALKNPSEQDIQRLVAGGTCPWDQD